MNATLRRRLALAACAVALAIAVGAAAWYLRHRAPGAPQAIAGKASIGEAAPPFAVSTTSGLFDLRQTDKPVFLEVFSTWCQSCRGESATIDKLYAKYGSQVAFVGVSSSDTASDGTSAGSQNDVLAWAQKYNVRYPVAFDRAGFVAGLYLQGSFPTFAVIDKGKNIVYLNSGEIDYNDLAAAIEKALSE